MLYIGANNLVNEKMKRLFPFFAFLTFGYSSASAQLLWKISGEGIESPSYLLGTHHFCTGEFCDSIPGFYEAFSQVEQVCTEVDINSFNKVNSPEFQRKLRGYMSLPEGVTLSSFYSKEEFDEIAKYLSPYFGNNPEVYRGLKPITLIINIQNIIMIELMPEFESSSGIDQYVQELAAEEGKKSIGLESVEFQMELLYNTPLEDQALQLLELCRNGGIKEEAMELTDAYKAKNLKKLDKLTRKGCDKEEYETMVKGRNVAWTETIVDNISTTPTLFAVGAGHLPGKYGLIEKKRKKGYQVEAILQ